jgi:prevent-host-death family protein
MSERVYNLSKARSTLSKLVGRAASGEEIIIAKAGRPLARLVPLAARKRARRKPGGWEGKVQIADDFDAPLPPDLRAGFGCER